ncbi:MAG: SGNH/GDSL hydrolase family protein [Planctomycetota bacterium]|nr:MAG: SGNH/GDSL hydrolase family protein [Planctomycetota bacterium]
MPASPNLVSRRLVLVLVALLSVGLAPAARGADRPRVLDGREKSIVVVGYSTSYAWPDMLQEMLDEHAGGRRLYHVLNAVVGGAPVAHWIAEPGTREHSRTVAAMTRDFFGPDARLRGDAPEPTVAICQQSLQLTRDDRGPVKTEHDMVGAEMGADALETMALRLRDLGLEQVWIAMHIYKEPVEPEVGNERVALARLLARGHGFIHEGPDLWRVTKDCFPGCFTDDRLHPNELGMKLMAEHWYRALAGDEAREDIIERMHARSYDTDAMMRRYLAWRRGEG